jgi:hypothetical protein
MSELDIEGLHVGLQASVLDGEDDRVFIALVVV